jgi:hypothetical protein
VEPPAANTEEATGHAHLVIVEDGETLHVTFVETLRVRVVYDDPSCPVIDRKGTDTQHFNLTKGGTQTFSESYHESFNRDGANNFLTFRYYRTFVSTGDDIRVDRCITIGPNPCP